MCFTCLLEAPMECVLWTKTGCPDRVHVCWSTSWTMRKIRYHVVIFMCPTPYILALCFAWACLSLYILTLWHLQEHDLWTQRCMLSSVTKNAAVGLRGTETRSVPHQQAARKGSPIISSTSCRFCARLLWTCGISLTIDAYPNESATYLAPLVLPGCLQMGDSVFSWTNGLTPQAYVLPVQASLGRLPCLGRGLVNGKSHSMLWSHTVFKNSPTAYLLFSSCNT